MLFALFCATLVVTGYAEYPIATFKTEIRCEAPPEAVGSVIKPFSMYVENDELGRVFILDSAERKVFIWDKNGKFIRTLGQQGEGPGELMIEDGWANITVTDKHIVVIDDRIKKISLWDKEYNFIKSVPLKGLSRVADLHFFKGQYLFVSSNHRREDMRLLAVNQSFEIEEELASVQDALFRKNAKKGWIYNPLADRLITAVGKDDIWVGNSNENWIRQVDLKGNIIREHRIPMYQTPISGEDLTFYQRQFAKWGSEKDKFIKPEDNPYFDTLISLNDGLLIASQHLKEGGICRGLVIEKGTGSIKAEYSVYLGEDAFIAGVSGKILFITANQNGDYQVELKKLILPGGI